MSTSQFLVEITDIALPKDFGVAKKDGRVIFVPGAVVGDTVTVRIAREDKRYAYGEIMRIDVPSPLRERPECTHFGFCGGCIMQHLQYSIQLEIKHSYLLENLRRIGGINLEKNETIPVNPSPDLYFYRNKLELSFGQKNNEVVLGLRERLSPFKSYDASVTPLNECPVFSAVIPKLIPIFAEFAHIEGLIAFNPLTKKGVLKHLILRESKATGEIMVILETRAEALQGIERVIYELKQRVPEVVSFYHATNRRTDDIVHFERINRLFGARSLVEKVSNLSLKIYPQTFLQPNTRGAALLYEGIAHELNLNGNESIIGMYSGIGAIEIFFSSRAFQVIGIDSERANISAAQENCIFNHTTNCTFYQSRAEDVLKHIDLPKADILVIDPPRTGLSKQGLRVMKELNIPKIAYVSCNPSTLARDLRELCSHGYSIHRIAPYDLFPHTGHLETLAILER